MPAIPFSGPLLDRRSSLLRLIHDYIYNISFQTSILDFPLQLDCDSSLVNFRHHTLSPSVDARVDLIKSLEYVQTDLELSLQHGHGEPLHGVGMTAVECAQLLLDTDHQRVVRVEEMTMGEEEPL